MAKNKNYIRGRRFEYDVMLQARKQPGAMVFRTAGSHGEYDVIAFFPETKDIVLTQCKTKLTTNESLKGKTVEDEIKMFSVYKVTGRKLTKYITRRK